MSFYCRPDKKTENNYFEVEISQWDKDRTRIIVGFICLKAHKLGSIDQINHLHHVHLHQHPKGGAPIPMFAFEVPIGSFTRATPGPERLTMVDQKFDRNYATGDTVGIGFRFHQVRITSTALRYFF